MNFNNAIQELALLANELDHIKRKHLNNKDNFVVLYRQYENVNTPIDEYETLEAVKKDFPLSNYTILENTETTFKVQRHKTNEIYFATIPTTDNTKPLPENVIQKIDDTLQTIDDTIYELQKLKQYI